METIINKLKSLKAQRTKLLNKPCETMEQFEIIQNKLNEIDMQMRILMEVNEDEKI